MFLSFFISAIYVNVVFAGSFFGKFENVPQNAIDVGNSGFESHIVNGDNLQSRIDVSLLEISENRSPQKIVVPVDREYKFQALNLSDGEYQLQIYAYDFNLRIARYRVCVRESQIEAFEDRLGSSSYNISSKHVVSSKSPLPIEISGFKSYYESKEGRLLDMVMNSPFGFIFRSKLYSCLFFGSLVIMVFPYVIPYISPEFAETYQELQKETNGAGQQKDEAKSVSEEVSVPVVGAAAGSQQRLRRRK